MLTTDASLPSFAPCRCLTCEASVSSASLLCTDCFADLRLRLNVRSQRREHVPQLRVASAGSYEGAWRRLIQLAKSQPSGILPTALAFWLRALLLHWSTELRAWEIDIIAWVPGHPLRRRLETDLAGFMAAELSRALGVPARASLLTRRLRGWRDLWQSQKDRSRRDRLSAYGLFRSHHEAAAPGARVLLVDDVSTTGGSLRACREALEKKGFQVVGAFVLAHVPCPGAPVEADPRAE